MADASSIEMSPEQEAEALEHMQNIVGGAISAVSSFLGGGQEAEPKAAAEPVPEQAPPQPAEAVEINYNRDEGSGAIIRPEADGAGLQQRHLLALGEGYNPPLISGMVPEFARNGLDYSSGQIDMIDNLARSYDGIDADSLQGTLISLAADDALRDDVMDAMMANDQELAHYAAQAFEQDPNLLVQFEYLVREEPETIREMLPAMEEDPSKFHEIIRNRNVDTEAALLANKEAAPDTAAEMDLQGMLTGVLANILGPDLINMFQQFGTQMMGFANQMMESLMGSVNGFVTQFLDEDGPGRDFMEAAGLDPDAVKVDAADPEAEPQGPKSEPRNENDPNRDVTSTPSPHTM